MMQSQFLILEIWNNDADVLSQLKMPDEDHFHLSGYVIRQNF